MKKKTLFLAFTFLALFFILLLKFGQNYCDLIFVKMGLIKKQNFDLEVIKIVSFLKKNLLLPFIHELNTYSIALFKYFFYGCSYGTLFSKLVHLALLGAAAFGVVASCFIFLSIIDINIILLELCRIIFFLIGYIVIFDVSIFFSPYKTMILMGLWSFLMHISFYFSAKRDIVLRSLNENLVINNYSFFDFEFLIILLKKTVALLVFMLGIFFLTRSLLIYNNTTVKKVLIKALR